ncbi:MAG: TonB-dependent receptor domain-containing protein [Steroidobacteraceae bacterium]
MTTGAIALAQAQEPPPQSSQQAAQSQANEQESLSTVTVTGSRIAAPNAVSTSPITVLSSKYLQQTGKTDIGDVITQLPQNFNNGLGQDLGNGTSGLSSAGGVSTADLRGLGPNRTLVLVDGRRLGQGSPYTFIQSPAPDLDQIPSGLVERVEVVTGGASAAYGSDAIAGVINFIMKKNFQGVQVDGQWNEYWHDNGDTFIQNQVTQFGATPATGTSRDGIQRDFDVLMGTNFAGGQGNITAYLSYRHQDPVASSQRDYGGCQVYPVTAADNSVTGLTCGGSSNSNWFEPFTGPNAKTAYSVMGNGFVPYGTAGTVPPAEYNSQTLIYMTREDDRYNAAILAHQDINDYVKPYAEVYFMDDRTHQQVAPAALFKDANPLDPFGTGEYPVNCGNSLLSSQEASLLCSPAQLASVAPGGQYAGQACAFNTDPVTGAVTSPNCADVQIGRRNIEGGGRNSDYEHENYRAVLGTKGEFADAWTYDLYGQYYYTTFFNSNTKYFNFQAIDDALQVTGPAANPVCISGGSCVPYNIWSSGAVTPAMLQYLYLMGTGAGNSTLRTLHAEVTGDLGEYGITSPLAHEGVAVDVGWEHRNDHEFFEPDSAEQSGLLSGFGSAAVPIDNSVSVGEEFLEVRAPLIEDQPFVHQLIFDSGYRHSDYTTIGTTDTYKFELQYSPIPDYRLRLSYNTAIRAPSVVELFNPQLVGLASVNGDPCAATVNSTGVLSPAVDSLAQCQNMGVTAAQYGNGGTTNTIPQGTAGQLSQLTGGNPHLSPESAETYTIGLNFAPSQVQGLTGSIDFYHIAISGEVGTIPFSTIFTNCANTGSPVYCSQIVRNPVTGGLTGNNIANGGYVIQTNVNTGAALASGIDVSLGYTYPLPIGLGSLDFALNGTWLDHFETTPVPGAHTYDCASLFGFTCQTVNPRWHHIASLTWNTPWWGLSTTARWRYISGVSQDNDSNDPSLHFATWGAYDYANASIPSYSYLDLEADWHVLKQLTLRVGVNNALDKDPPLIDSFIVAGGQANTYTLYDFLGRQVYAAFTAKF